MLDTAEEEIEQQESSVQEKSSDQTGIEDDFNEDDFVATSLTIKQKLLLGLSGLSAFLLFAILLFPIEELMNSLVTEYSNRSGIMVDFKKLRFPLIGKKTIDSLTISSASGLNLKTEETEIDSGLISIIQGMFSGSIKSNSIKFEKGDIGINIRSFFMEGKLGEFTNPLAELNGNLVVQINNGNFTKFPVLPLFGEMKDLVIRNCTFIFKIRSGKVQIDKGVIETSIGKITIKGRIELNNTFNFSRIDLEICPKLSQAFSAERPDLADMLQLLNKGGNTEACIPVQGTINQPKVNQNIMESSGGPGSTPPITPPAVAPTLKTP